MSPPDVEAVSMDPLDPIKHPLRDEAERAWMAGYARQGILSYSKRPPSPFAQFLQGYVAGRAALLARLNEAEARANTATVAADLMRARAEKAERERDAMREERDDAIGRTSMERYSDGRVGEARMESVVYGLGVCTDWYFDDYDYSVEMLGTRNGWLPTKEERDLLSATGIAQAFLSYLDGTAVLVNLSTGDYGPCSHRSSESDKSALVSKAERERDEAVKVADVATDTAAKAVLDAKEVYEVRHLKRIEEVTKERDEAVGVLREARVALFAPRWDGDDLISRIDALTKARG